MLRESLLDEKAVLLMPALNAIIAVLRMDTLFTLRPANPVRFTVSEGAYHLFWHRQICIDCGRERVDQLWPCLIPQPEHRRAVAAEAALRGALLRCGLAPVLCGCVFPRWPMLELYWMNGHALVVDRHLLNDVFPFGDLERVRYATEVYASAIATNLSTDRTGAELIGYGGMGLQRKFYHAAVAAALKSPVPPPSVQGVLHVCESVATHIGILKRYDYVVQYILVILEPRAYLDRQMAQ